MSCEPLLRELSEALKADLTSAATSESWPADMARVLARIEAQDPLWGIKLLPDVIERPMAVPLLRGV